jgi:hypothetical protein
VIAELEGDARARALGLARGHAARMSALAPERAYRRVVGLLARRGHPPSVAHWAARIALGLDPEPD